MKRNPRAFPDLASRDSADDAHYAASQCASDSESTSLTFHTWHLLSWSWSFPNTHETAAQKCNAPGFLRRNGRIDTRSSVEGAISRLGLLLPLRLCRASIAAARQTDRCRQSFPLLSRKSPSQPPQGRETVVQTINSAWTLVPTRSTHRFR